MNFRFWILDFGLAALLLTGCGESLIEKLAKDNASICGYTTAVYGAGAIIPTPTIPLAGVYAHNRFCRSNEAGSEIEVKPDGTLKIKHGTDKPRILILMPRDKEEEKKEPKPDPLPRPLPQAGEGRGEGTVRHSQL